jgi:uncharacterized membrane protein
MVRFQNRIEILRPLDEVFEFVSQLENIPRWNYYVTRVERTSEGRDLLGSEYQQIRRTDRQKLRVVAYDPNRLLVIEAVPPSKPVFRREMSFIGNGDTTTIVDSWSLDLGFPGLIERFSKDRVRSAVNENLQKLKELLENGNVTLQDGKVITGAV